MSSFGEKSIKLLQTIHPDLQLILVEAIKYSDFTILEGQRSPERQKELFSSGATKTMASKHLKTPSLAVDIAPFPVNFSDTTRFYFLAGVIMSTAARLFSEKRITSRIRWGGDWNRNRIFTDENFRDLVHFEVDYD